MNISLPESLKGFVDSRVKAGGYSSVSEYVRDLVREDQKRQTQENLEALLLEATRSGAGSRIHQGGLGSAPPRTRQASREATCEMSLRAVVRSSAETNLLESAMFIAEDDPAAAQRFLDEAEKASGS